MMNREELQERADRLALLLCSKLIGDSVDEYILKVALGLAVEKIVEGKRGQGEEEE